MGKKKSVVLMVLLTVVIVALCALLMFPSFSLGGPNSWNPVVLQYDFGMELNGGRYAYYYPEGVISETEYTETKADREASVDQAQAAYDAAQENGTAQEKTKTKAALDKAKKDLDEYIAGYKRYGETSLYLSADENDNILNAEVSEDATSVLDEDLTTEFKTAFASMAQDVSDRFKQKEYSNYKVSTVDGYCLRVEVPKSASDGTGALQLFASTGKMTLTKGDEVLDELADEDSKLSDYVTGFSVQSQYWGNYYCIKIHLNAAGAEMIASIKSGLSSSSEASSDSSSATALKLKIGDDDIVSIYSDSISDYNNEILIMQVEADNKSVVDTYAILFNSLLQSNGYDYAFKSVSSSDIRSFDPVYGDNAVTLLYIALGIVLLLILVLPVVKMGRFGIVSGYSNLTYLVITGICFKYITGAVFELTLGSVLVFLAGLALINVLQYHIYKSIKTEFELGKTVESSVKGGYKKTLWNVVDIYAVLLLGALAFLFGAAGLHTVALQTLICVLTGAFVNLLWARFINFTFLSASKNKYKYFRFVREDDDDE